MHSSGNEDSDSKRNDNNNMILTGSKIVVLSSETHNQLVKILLTKTQKEKIYQPSIVDQTLSHSSLTTSKIQELTSHPILSIEAGDRKMQMVTIVCTCLTMYLVMESTNTTEIQDVTQATLSLTSSQGINEADERDLSLISEGKNMTLTRTLMVKKLPNSNS